MIARSPIVQSDCKLEMSHVELDRLVIVLDEGVCVSEAVAGLSFDSNVPNLSRYL